MPRKYLYNHDDPPTAATPNPQTDRNPAATRNTIVPTGSQMGLDNTRIGAKKMRPRNKTVTVMPVRKRRMEPEMKRVRKPISCEELGECAWSLRMMELTIEEVWPALEGLW